MREPVVIYKDKSLLAINKPAGLLVHGRNKHIKEAESTLTEWLLEHFPEVRTVGDDPAFRPGIVHRLDKDTSGVILVPRTHAYFLYLKELFKKREIQKTYLALVVGIPKEKSGVINRAISMKNGTVKRTLRSGKMTKEAVTEYALLGTQERSGEIYSLLRVTPKTGRTHQIRIHLASIGHPIVGDALYGKKKQPAWVTRLMLHALSVEFTAEDGGKIKIEAEPGADFSA
jgi:23S rRNA pseudouridine1911/1915/1917 synthase